MLVISFARNPRCWLDTRPPSMSASLGTDLSMRPDAEVDRYLHLNLAVMNIDEFLRNRSYVGAL